MKLQTILLKNTAVQYALLLGVLGGSFIWHHQATHPSVVIMHIDGQAVEGKVLDYAPACRAPAPMTPAPQQSESPIRN